MASTRRMGQDFVRSSREVRAGRRRELV